MAVKDEHDGDSKAEKDKVATWRATDPAPLYTDPVTERRALPLTEDRIAIPVPLLERDRATLTVVIGPELGLSFTISSEEVTLGRAPECFIRVDDPGVSRRHARLMRNEFGYFIEDLNSVNGTLIDGFRISARHRVRDGDRVGLGPTVSLRFALADEAEERCQKLVYESGVLDALTGTYNRRHFFERLAGELAFARRHQEQLSLLMVDIDRFKAINDQCGHLGGDAALRVGSDVMRKALRAEDFLARYGGDEFAILARGIELTQAAAMGERLRALVEKATVEYAGNVVSISVSIGVASLTCCPRGGSTEELLGIADARLYAAKQRGRNRVSFDT